MPPRLPLALTLAVLFPGLLAAAPARGEEAVSPFAPVHEQMLVGLDDFTFDSDWFPMDAPLQLRLIAHGGNSVQIDMPGAGRYDWDNESIDFVGDPDAGRLGLDIGLTLDAKIRFDVLGLQWESDILGPYDYAVIAEDGFTPYLLPGNPERPVNIDDETDPVTFVSVPVTPDIIVAAGNLDIDAYVIVAATLVGDAIEAATTAPMAQLATVVAEGESVSLLAGQGPLPDPLEVDGTLVCGLTTDITIVLKPTLVMEILGQKFEIADIEIPIDLPPFADAIRFAPITMSFPRPPPPPPDPTTGDGDSHGNSSSDSDTSGEPPTTGEVNDTEPDGATTNISDSAPGEAGGADESAGCECAATHEQRSPPLLALLLIGLATRRSRARRDPPR
ncbi:hypothetical protein [Nannocystis sp.]|uniref:hypothetical protein n=1 Tax=Nannocystis sp. TaxID=1962667 RepID=UPI0025E23450|nr:hypothetical protein [Nannocystis sp.]MBK7826282.1 hypothetical protein [Nannocystis sp.]